jgi:hypothetical protein
MGFFPDPGSPNHILENLVTVFGVYFNSGSIHSIGSNFFLYLFKNKIRQFWATLILDQFTQLAQISFCTCSKIKYDS